MTALSVAFGSACGPAVERPEDITATPVPVVEEAPAVAPPAALGEPLALAVYKQKRELVVFRHGEPETRFPIRLGYDPGGHKEREGDYRTPEGVYRVCTVRPSRFKTFLWIDYPNQADAERALLDEKLSHRDYERILRALDQGRCPPPDTPLGGLIGIHGDHEEPPRQYDWTEGCIALTRNQDLLDLVKLVTPGTPVVVFP